MQLAPLNTATTPPTPGFVAERPPLTHDIRIAQLLWGTQAGVGVLNLHLAGAILKPEAANRVAFAVRGPYDLATGQRGPDTTRSLYFPHQTGREQHIDRAVREFSRTLQLHLGSLERGTQAPQPVAGTAYLWIKNSRDEFAVYPFDFTNPAHEGQREILRAALHLERIVHAYGSPAVPV